MANGTRGDHPINDILDHGVGVFSPEADALVREIATMVPRYRLVEMLDWFAPPPIDELTATLRQLLVDLRNDARSRGWEV